MDMKDVRISSYHTADAGQSGWTIDITHLPTGARLTDHGDGGMAGYFQARARLLATLEQRLAPPDPAHPEG